MTVNDFIEEYKEDENCVEKHIVNTYVLYERKISICQKIADITSYVDINDKKMFKLNSPLSKMLFLLNMINEYTDIDVNFDNGLHEFNLLEENNITSIILSHIPEIEFDRFMGVMEMVTDDMLSTRDLSSFLETKLEAIGMVMNTMMEAFNTPEIQDNIIKFLNK